jgi:nucleotide-binding universal stress UspA family protein
MQVIIVVCVIASLIIARSSSERERVAATRREPMIAPCSARSSWAPTARTRPARPSTRRSTSPRRRRRLSLVSAYEPVPKARCARRRARRRRPAVDGQPARGGRRDAARRRRRRARAGVEVETFAREGDPADAILDVAEERDADLIIVGNKGMTGAGASCSARCRTRSPTTRPARC